MHALRLKEIKAVPVKFLRARCGVRYWEDGTVNGEEDADGSRIPCREGTAADNDHLGADVTVTLPVAAQMRGRELSVVLIADSGGIGIVDGSGTEQISGQLTQEIDSQWGSVRVYSDGSAWRVF
jgi:hypothetical protein